MYVLAAIWTALASAAPLPEARVDAAAPPTVRELDAEARLGDRPCPKQLAYVPIGFGRLCSRRPVEGVVLLGLFGGNAAILQHGGASPVGQMGAIGIQNAISTSIGLDALDGWLAHRRRYTAPENLGELARAPFRPAVFRRTPGVIAAPLLGAAAVATTLLVAGDTDEPLQVFGGRPVILGWQPPAGVGYPLGYLGNSQMLLQVALGEELLFRGVLQGAATRWLGVPGGIALTSLTFFAAHIPNWIGAPPRIAAMGALWVATAGTTFTLLHHRSGYRLSSAVAAHFWYNAVVFGTAFAMDPEQHVLQARITLPL